MGIAAPQPEAPQPEGRDQTEAETKEAGVGLLFNRGAGNQGWAVKTAIKVSVTSPASCFKNLVVCRCFEALEPQSGGCWQGSPAEASGQILEGDVLVSVDGKPVDEVHPWTWPLSLTVLKFTPSLCKPAAPRIKTYSLRF